MIRGWLQADSDLMQAASVGGFLYATLASILLGMALSALRWLVIDSLNASTGLRRPTWSDASLQQNLQALESLIEHHYRYYQFHSNMVVAIVLVYSAHLAAGSSFLGWGSVEAIGALICTVFWLTARDNLKKYYASITTLLQENPMSNGRHHGPKSQSAAKAKTKSESDQPAKTAKPSADQQKK